MKKVMIQLLSFIFLMPICALAKVGSDENFEVLKSLNGSWNIHTQGKQLPFKMTYDLVSKDSVVTEYFGQELSVFYRENDGIYMVHYCNNHTQPRLKLKQDGEKNNVLIFETYEVANLDNPDASHVLKIIYKIMSEHKMELQIVWQKKNSEETETYLLTRS